jgi:flagellar hook protein FlgE
MEFYDKLGNAYTAKFKLSKPATASATASENTYDFQLTDIVDKNNKSMLDEIADGGSISIGGASYTITKSVAATATTPAVAAYVTPSTVSQVRFNATSGAFISTTASAKTNTLDLKITSKGDNADGTLFGKNGVITMDCSSITQYSTTGACNINSNKGDLEGAGAGKKVGKLSGVSIGQDGKIYGSYDNGTSKLLGQIAVANFSNPAGLEAAGAGLFAATQNSGDFDGRGSDVTADGGKLSTGVLEMSNVDLSSEFTEMITTQRGFQANSRIITTSDSLLEELINLKR